MYDFKEGDVVKLKSGGPEMTIYQIGTASSPDRVVCTWFNGNKKEKDIFAMSNLEDVKKGERK
jgi:uncharacterized protein YodC (DUF2158 family)